ncbi:MAG TPA: hypothetical protein G4O11_11745, partial [Anaerolineae bacterium]|nr:hypothetical protein [Anaerolineae bacterium]
AVESVLVPVGVDQSTLETWLLGDVGYWGPPGMLPPPGVDIGTPLLEQAGDSGIGDQELGMSKAPGHFGTSAPGGQRDHNLVTLVPRCPSDLVPYQPLIPEPCSLSSG